MSALDDKLRAVSRRMTTVGLCRLALVASFACTVALAMVTFIVGRSVAAALIVVAAGIAIVAIGAFRLRRTPLDAARCIEQMEGWQERLSTACELRHRGDNVFRERLSSEAEGLARLIRPVEAAPFDLLKPLVSAGSAAVVLLALWLTLPAGIRGVIHAREDAQSRRRAAEIVKQSIDRFEDLAATSASARELRLRLVGLLDNLRRPTDVAVARREAAALEEGADMSAGDRFRDAIVAMSDKLDASTRLRPLSDTLRLRNLDAFRHEAERLAGDLPGMDEGARNDAAAAFSAAASDNTAGLSDPLKDAAKAMLESDAVALASALKAVGDGVAAHMSEARGDDEAAREFLSTIERVRAVLAGGNDPGPRAIVGEMAAVVEGAPGDDNAVAGNLVVRSRPPDLASVVKSSTAVSDALPDLSDIVKAADAAQADPRLDAEIRRYVRRYFNIDNETE